MKIIRIENSTRHTSATSVFYSGGLTKSVDCWTKCIVNQSVYTEM